MELTLQNALEFWRPSLKWRGYRDQTITYILGAVHARVEHLPDITTEASADIAGRLVGVMIEMELELLAAQGGTQKR
jgi:hypothetical protein